MPKTLHPFLAESEDWKVLGWKIGRLEGWAPTLPAFFHPSLPFLLKISDFDELLPDIAAL